MIIFLIVSFFVFSFNGLLFAKDHPSGDLSTLEVLGDVLWVRPPGFMHMALGATVFVVSLPVIIPKAPGCACCAGSVSSRATKTCGWRTQRSTPRKPASRCA